MILAVILVVVIGQCLPTEQTQLIGAPGNGEYVPMDFRIEGGLGFLESGQPAVHQAFFRQSSNLYDFVKHLEARKVVGDVCYIRKFKGSLKMGLKLLSSAMLGKPKVTTQVSEDWDVPGKEIKGADLKKTVGAKIAKFCRGYRVFWVTKRKKVTRRDVMEMTRRQLSGSGRFGYSPNTGFRGSGRLGYTGRNGFSVNGGLGFSRPTGLSSNLGFGYKKGGWSANGGLSHSRNGGLSSSLGVGYKKGGFSFQGGLNHNRNSGLGASLGLKWKF